MTAHVKPTSFVAGKIITLNGTTYQPGDAITWANLKTVRNISSLVSSRRIIPLPSNGWHQRTLPAVPTPSDTPAAVLKETIL